MAMIDKADTRLLWFMGRIRDTLFANNNIAIAPQFYMTHYCNLSCPGCYMAATPNRPRDCVPSGDIDFYLREFKKNPAFLGVTTFSGGEIFSQPTQYLQYNIQNALDLGIYTEIKTNGSWVDNPARSDRIFEMLGGLAVPRGVNASPAQIESRLRQYARSELQSMGRDKIMAMLQTEFGAISTLSMSVSVDNKIHPVRSADWFAAIARRIGGDSRLAQNIELKGVGFTDSFDFFMQNVIKNPHLGVSDFRNENGVFYYRVGGCRVQSGFAEFCDTSAPVAPEVAADIVTRQFSGIRFVTIYFRPDKTVCFEDSAMRPVGRVSYLDAAGKCIPLDELVQDMVIKMVTDYKKSIGR